MVSWRFRLAVACLSVCFGGSARAESPELPDANYKNLRYQDNEAALAKLDNGADFWAPFKYIPLGGLGAPAGPSYLSIGGELRERMESYDHQNFGFSKAPASDTYVLHRSQLDADLHLSDYFRMFMQFSYDDRFGDRGVTSTTDLDRGDVTQAFAELRAPTPLGDAPTLRVGREELVLGYQRLVAVREGPNARRSFDGVDLSDSLNGFKVDVVDVHPVTNDPGPFNDAANLKQQLQGVYLTAPIYGGLKLDLYDLQYENDAAKFRNFSGVERVNTFGLRAFGEAKGWDWNLEAAEQLGTFGKHPVQASLFAGIVGYTFQDVTFTPRIAVSANYASGDNGKSNTIGTFNAMYPRLPYFAETSQLVPSNVKDIRPLLTFDPLKNVQTVLGWDTLWRASTTDGLYGSGETLYFGTNTPKVKASLIGNEASFDTRWRVDDHLTVGAIAARLAAGPAITQAGGTSENFFVLYAKYRF